MPLHLYRDADSFAAALAASPGALYSICNRDRLEASQLLALERRAAAAGHRELLHEQAARNEALRAVEGFFGEAAELDRDWRFIYSSKVILSIPGYQDIQKVFLLHAVFGRTPDRNVLLLAPDTRLRRLFAELFCGERPRERVPFPAARAWARFARTFGRALLAGMPRSSGRVLFFSVSSGAPRSDTDAYFGTFAQTVAAQAPTTQVYLASGPAMRLPASEARFPFEAFLSGRTVVSTWMKSLLTASKDFRVHAASRFAPLHRFVRAVEIRSGEYFMQRLYERGFGRMLARIRPEVLVYPFENRSWEKLLLGAARKARVGRAVAYQHSSITPRHLAFEVPAGEVQPDRLPDTLVTIGDYTSALLARSAPALADRIVTGASLRTVRQAIADAGGPAVLVAISSNRNEALSLLQTTYEAACEIDVPFIVRTHPTIPVNDLFAMFSWPAHVTLSVGTTLAQDLARVTMVAYSSSTVALEGMLYGRLPLFVDIGDVPSGDPIGGDPAFKASVSTGSELAQAVRRLQTLDPERLRTLQEAARAFAERYLRAPEPDALRRMTEAVLGR